WGSDALRSGTGAGSAVTAPSLHRDERDTARDDDRTEHAQRADALAQDEGGEGRRDHDARLAHRGDRRRRGEAKRRQHEEIRAEGGAAGEDRERAELGPERRDAP